MRDYKTEATKKTLGSITAMGIRLFGGVFATTYVIACQQIDTKKSQEALSRSLALHFHWQRLNS